MVTVREEVPACAAQGIEKHTKAVGYVVKSPFFAAKSKVGHDKLKKSLAPYWAVPRNHGNETNMTKETMRFQLPYPSLAGTFPKLAKNSNMWFDITILRNTRSIKAYEALKLPYECE